MAFPVTVLLQPRLRQQAHRGAACGIRHAALWLSLQKRHPGHWEAVQQPHCIQRDGIGMPADSCCRQLQFKLHLQDSQSQGLLPCMSCQFVKHCF